MEKKKDKIKIKKMGNGKKRGREIVKKKKKLQKASLFIHISYQMLYLVERRSNDSMLGLDFFVFFLSETKLLFDKKKKKKKKKKRAGARW